MTTLFARFPVIPGHEITGTVAGAGVRGGLAGRRHPRRPAQFLHHSDGHCDYCARGDQILCPSKQITGIAVDGGYAEYCFVRPPGCCPPMASTRRMARTVKTRNW